MTEKTSVKNNARVISAKIILRLLEQQGSLASELSLAKNLDEKDQRFTQELCYGVCRWYFFLEKTLQKFIAKPLKNKDKDIKILLLLGLYQLQFTRVAPHAAINETVNVAVAFRKVWAKKLINGVLRSFQRSLNAETPTNPSGQDYIDSHPSWLQQAINRAWPQQASDIFIANNQHPPFTLRVNQHQISTEAYQDKLTDVFEPDFRVLPTSYSAAGLYLEKAVDVSSLPGFDQGLVSVQDEAAQLAAPLLKLESGLRVLDACCAPGGKTCHIGESQADLQELVAIDSEERRLPRVRENLVRLDINAQVICADATQTDQWWDGKLFDRILLDAPCSATGVIRRHPDIKLLRSQEDIRRLASLQLQLLQALWPLLKEGGILLYATCSIFPEENTQVVEQFISSRDNVYHDKIIANWGIEQPFGRQLFPKDSGHDGFYYARLIKQ